MTYPVDAAIQDRQAESVYSVLLEEGPKVFQDLKNYGVRANLCWAATWGLNNWMSCGVPQDWTTHNIGHEITAFAETDHAKTLDTLNGLFYYWDVYEQLRNGCYCHL